MTLMHDYYKNQLTDEGKRIYDALLSNINKLARRGSIQLYGFFLKSTMEDAAQAYMALRDDRPEFFFLDKQVEITYSSIGVLRIRQPKRFSFDQIVRINRLLVKKIHEILEKSEGKPVIYREKEIYRYIATSFQYKEGDLSHDISGLIIFNEGVCESLSGLLVLALREAKIPAIKQRGYARNERHSWVKAWINEREYHLDVTWDMPLARMNMRYRYFNLTEEEIKRDHFLDDSNRNIKRMKSPERRKR